VRDVTARSGGRRGNWQNRDQGKHDLALAGQRLVSLKFTSRLENRSVSRLGPERLRKLAPRVEDTQEAFLTVSTPGRFCPGCLRQIKNCITGKAEKIAHRIRMQFGDSGRWMRFRRCGRDRAAIGTATRNGRHRKKRHNRPGASRSKRA